MADSVMGGRFRKVSRIGRGTFGEAWLVTSCCSGRRFCYLWFYRYVIKEVRVDEMEEEELEKTRQEATILARCKHSSIIRYKEYFMLENPTTMCLVMEYADGGDLSLRVKETKRRGELMDEEDVLHWFVQVIFAVQYLHINNILHRDLKTQNVFLTKSNLVKVGDFGIARFLRDKQDLATTAIGTPYYLSPEICQRRPYNHKSDMWAVGCILYELCALDHPFQAKSFDDLIVSILRGSYKPLPEKFSGLVQDLTRVMLRTNPDRRPTADALLILPALKPYVENYLVKQEELVAQRTNTKHSQKEREKHNKDALRKDELFRDVLKIHVLKKCNNLKARGSIDLGQIQPRKQYSESSPQESSIFNGKLGEDQKVAAGVGVTPRPRCASDSALEWRKNTPTPTTPDSSSSTPKPPNSAGGDFKTPPRVLRYKKKKNKKRVDTPMPKIVRKIHCQTQKQEQGQQQEEKQQIQEEKQHQRNARKQLYEDEQQSPQEKQHHRDVKQQLQEEKQHQRNSQQQLKEIKQQQEHQEQQQQQQRLQHQHEEEKQQQQQLQQQREGLQPPPLPKTLGCSGSSCEELVFGGRRNTMVRFSSTYIIPRSLSSSSVSDNDFVA